MPGCSQDRNTVARIAGHAARQDAAENSELVAAADREGFERMLKPSSARLTIFASMFFKLTSVLNFAAAQVARGIALKDAKTQ